MTSEDLKYVKKIDPHLNADLNFSLGTNKKPFRRKDPGSAKHEILAADFLGRLYIILLKRTFV